MDNLKTLIIIDARHTLYDERRNGFHKYNFLLARSLKLIQEIGECLIIFSHKNQQKNQHLHSEFSTYLEKHNIKIQLQLSTIDDVQQLKFPNTKIIVITHDYINFRIEQPYQLYYFSSYFENINKKLSKEQQFYQQVISTHHISHLEQVISQTTDMGQQLLVGYYFYPKKQNELLKHALLQSNKKFRYVPIDFRFYNQSQYKHLKAIFHKILDIKKSTEINLLPEEVQLFYTNYHKLTQEYNLINIDTVDKLDLLVQRDTFIDSCNQLFISPTYQKIKDTCDHKIQFKTPNQVSFDNTNNKQVDCEVEFPIIVKSKAGAFTTNCHLMAIVVSLDGLTKLLQIQEFKCQLVFQQLINHDSVIYKIYCIGEHQIIQKRKSIPNITIDNFRFDEVSHYQIQGFHIFDTQQDLFTNVSKCVKEANQNNYLDIVLPHEASLKNHISVLQSVIIEQFNIQLFGFDVIGNFNSMEFYLIDLNHFPGYKNVDKMDDIIEQLLIKQYKL